MAVADLANGYGYGYGYGHGYGHGHGQKFEHVFKVQRRSSRA